MFFGLKSLFIIAFVKSKEIEQKNILFNSTPNFIFRSKYNNMRIYSKTLKEIYYFEVTISLFNFSLIKNFDYTF